MRSTSLFLHGAIFIHAFEKLSKRPYAENFLLPLPVADGAAGVYSAVVDNGAGSVQVYKPNSTSYEWWYFDAVSDDLKSSVVFQPDWNYANETAPLTVRMSFSFEDNSTSSLTFPGPEVYFSTVGHGVSAIAKDGSFSWVAKPDMSAYSMELKYPEHNITGRIHYQSVAPAHGPCSAAVSGAPLDISWDLFWVNPLPDAQVTVDMVVNGSAFAFQGIGYHDKNFAGYDFSPALNQWYWGHGRSGDLSVVWFDHLNVAGQESTSAYIAKDNKIIHAACSGVSVRPFGKGVGYPTISPHELDIEGYYIHIDAGPGGKYAFTAKATSVLGLDLGYGRWAGTLDGGLVGGRNSSGPAMWDQMGPFS
ncbi:hypothetical protein FOQG_15230 [Fusarium oxysporum f. sp. raphani 54005]|uniref:Hydroxyneurosporene synthase (CrtC) n=1 Tax=Fusarium oxysporum f. sp. raphani 54005 TaxID=1089458 RepID=X0BEJ3_FUSOX|nr:hypothetical protein FOQG_15230 [Fusarium oxysporum f. sp. raphani 54005]